MESEVSRRPTSPQAGTGHPVPSRPAGGHAARSHPDAAESRLSAAQPPPKVAGTAPNIADRFADLLAPLSNKRRRGLIARLSVGYYEGWHPTRAEVTALVTEELRRSFLLNQQRQARHLVRHRHPRTGSSAASIRQLVVMSTKSTRSFKRLADDSVRP